MRAKGPATAYTDFYKKGSKFTSPSGTGAYSDGRPDNFQLNIQFGKSGNPYKKREDDDEEDRRKAAIRRRLKAKRAR